MRSGMIGFLGAQPAAAGQPSWASVASLMHFDGSDGSTTMTDEKGRIWTPQGNAQLDTTQSRWGGSSLLLAGTGDYLTTPHDSQLNLSGPAATFQVSIRPSSISGIRTILSKRQASGVSTGYSFGFDGGKLFAIAWGAGGAVVVYSTGTTVLSVGAWYDIALRISDSEWGIYIGNTLEASATLTGSIANNSEPVFLGRDRTNTARGFVGHMDEERWTYDEALTIVAPTGPFPNA